jgi:hypothetical protein
MTKFPTIPLLAAAIAVATMLLTVANADVHAMTRHHAKIRHAAVANGSTTANQGYWPRHPCRNWHKICHPY